MTPLEVIEGALHELRQAHRWTRGVEARDGEGKPVCPRSNRAMKRSIEGALSHAAGDYREEFQEAKRVIRRSLAPGNPRGFNIFDWEERPGRTHREILLALEDAADTLRYGAVS